MKMREFKRYIKDNQNSEQSSNNSFANQLNEFDKESVEKRKAIIAEIITIANNSENWKEANAKFYELLESFKNISCTDKNELTKLNDELNIARKTYYDKRQDYYDRAGERFLANADKKEELIAELLSIKYVPDAIKATDERINKLTENFFEIKFAGDKQQKLYDQFNEIKSALREDRKTAVEILKETYSTKRDRKKEILAELTELVNCPNWKEGTIKFNELTEEFKTIGFSGKEGNDEISAAYKESKENFFKARQVFFDEMKANYVVNTEKRKEFIQNIKDLYVNENWKNASEIIKQISEDFFKVGYCGNDNNELLIKEFKEVRDGFYALRQEYFDGVKNARNDKQLDFLSTLAKNKEDFIVKLKGFISADTDKLEEFKNRLFSIRGENTEERIGKFQEIIEDIQTRVAANKTKLKVVQDELFQVKKQISEIKE